MNLRRIYFYYKNICLDPSPGNFEEIALDAIPVEIPRVVEPVVPAPKELKTQIDLKEILNHLPEQSKNSVVNPSHRVHQFKEKSRKRNSRQSDSTTVRQSDYK